MQKNGYKIYINKKQNTQIAVNHYSVLDLCSQFEIIPVGQFNPIPADDKRPIKFGTPWQQNSGINLYQPIIDFSIKNRVAESRINEKLKNTDAVAAEKDLKMEVIKSFSNIWLMEEQLRSTELDTLRTSRTKELIIARFKEGKILKTGVNRTILNHNNALLNYFTASSLLEQQQKTERMKYTPSIGFEGFLGASQYADTFNPFLAGTWYGSSYAGLSLKFQILSGTSTRNKEKQLILETKGIKSRLEDEIELVNNTSLRIAEEIRQIGYQVDISKENILLLEENIFLNQIRFEKGQINAYDLLTDEIDLQKEMSKFSEKSAELVQKQIELINNSGALSIFLNDLKNN